MENRCLHRSGPVATGPLEGDILTCPWHGFQYNLVSGELLVDPAADLEMYPVIIRDGEIYLQVPDLAAEVPASREATEPVEGPVLKGNEFWTREVALGQVKFLRVDRQGVVVYNVDGTFHAPANECTHAGGPLEESDLEGSLIVCPWHGSVFDVTTGKVVEEPAKESLQAFPVVIDGEIGRIEGVC